MKVLWRFLRVGAVIWARVWQGSSSELCAAPAAWVATGLTAQEREEYEERICAEREAAQKKLAAAEVGRAWGERALLIGQHPDFHLSNTLPAGAYRCSALHAAF